MAASFVIQTPFPLWVSRKYVFRRDTGISMLVEMIFCFPTGFYSEENREWQKSRSVGSCQG